MVSLRKRKLSRISMFLALSFCLAFVSAFSLVPTTQASSFDVWDGSTVSSSLSGSGAESEPYLIQSASDLAYFNANPQSDAYYKLTTDIDCNGMSWTPVNVGYFDGGNHTVKGFEPGDYIEDSSNSVYTGFFTSVKSLSNLKIVYSTPVTRDIGSVYSNYRFGGATTNAYSGAQAVIDNVHVTIDNLDITSSVDGNFLIGGIIAEATEHAANVTNCSVYMNANITPSGSINYIGGIVGLSGGSDVSDCYSRGSITVNSGSHVSGIVNNNTTSTVKRCYTTMSINADTSYTKQGSEIYEEKPDDCRGHSFYKCLGHCQGHAEVVGSCHGGMHYICDQPELNEDETVAMCKDVVVKLFWRCEGCYYREEAKEGAKEGDFKDDIEPHNYVNNDGTESSVTCSSTSAECCKIGVILHGAGGKGTITELKADGCNNWGIISEVKNVPCEWKDKGKVFCDADIAKNNYKFVCPNCGSKIASVYEEEDCIDKTCTGWKTETVTRYHSKSEMSSCTNASYHSPGYIKDGNDYTAALIDGCDNQELVDYGDCGNQHLYLDPTGQYEIVTVKTGYVNAISDVSENRVFFCSDSSLVASNTLNAPAKYGRTLSQMKVRSTYDSWLDFDDYWIIDSSVNDGLPVQKSTVSLGVNTAPILLDLNDNEITAKDSKSWSEVRTTGDGYYLSLDIGAPENETVSLNVTYDDGKYEFIGWARKSDNGYSILSDSTPYSFEMTKANEGGWYALFREVKYDLTTSLCVIKADGTEITDDSVLKEYVDLNVTVNGSTYAGAEIGVLDKLNFSYQYKNPNVDFFTFDHWRVNGTKVTADIISTLLDNGEISDEDHYLYTEFYDNIIAISKDSGVLDIVAVFRPVEYNFVVHNMDSTKGTLSISGDYSGESEITNGGTLIIKNVDVYSTIPAIRAYSETAAISGWSYTDVDGNEVQLFTFDQIFKEKISSQTTLVEQIVDGKIAVESHTLNYYVSFTNLYTIKVVTEVDFGSYTDYDQDCLAFVYNSDHTQRETEMIVFDGQEITFNYYDMSGRGYDFLGFYDKSVDNGFATYSKLPATGKITDDTTVYGVYMRKVVDFSIKVLDQSSDTICDFADYNKEILDIGVNAYNSSFITGYEIVNQGASDEKWIFTLKDNQIQTTSSYQRYNDYVNVALSLQNEMNKIYKVLGMKILSPDATVEQVIAASYTASASGSNTANMIMNVNNLEGKCIYMVYTKLDMSVQLAVETIDPGKTAVDEPSESLVMHNTELVVGNRVQDIKYGDTISFKSKAKTGFKFYGWKLPDGTVIQHSNISIDVNGRVTTLADDEEYNILTLSAFDSTLKGIYTAMYSKIAYKIVVDNLAGDSIFTIAGSSSKNVIEQFYINQIASITANIDPSKNYFGLSSQPNNVAEYFNSVQLTETLIALADENNTIKLYQVYEDNYLLTISITDQVHGKFTYKVNGETRNYSGAVYVTKNSQIEINVSVDAHYHFTITGVSEQNVSETGAEFTMSANTTVNIDVAIDTHKLEFEFEDGYEDGATLTGAGTYNYGQTVKIGAIINKGFDFVKWTIDNGAGSEIKLVSEFDYTITADTKCKIILLHRYTITTQVNDPQGAEITGSFELNEKDSAQITVTLRAGYSLQGWQIDGQDTDLTGTTITVIGEKTCTYTAVISQDKYYINVDAIAAVYGESGYTISAPQNNEYYTYNEQVEIKLITPKFLLRLNKLSANNVVLAINSAVTNESQLTVSLTAGNKEYFAGDTTVIRIDYTRIYALNIIKSETEAEDSVLNEMYYISKQTTGDTTTYLILDGTVVNIDTKDNSKYIFSKYEINVDGNFETLTTERETLFTVAADSEIRVVYLGKAYDIDFVYHVLDENGAEMTDFNKKWISNRTYSFKNADGEETLEFRYGSEITITPAILPYGLAVDHFTFDGNDSASSITVLMNKEGNITVDVYYIRVAISVSVYNSENGTITKIADSDIDNGNAIYTVTGEGQYYIGDSVVIKLAAVQAYKDYFLNKGWSIGDNKLDFVNYAATFNGNTYRVENNNRTIKFTLVPFTSETSFVLAPELDFTEFNINVAIYLNRAAYTPDDVPMATASIFVNGVDTESMAAKVHFKDRVEIKVTYNPTNSNDYVNVYKFDEMTCVGYSIENNVTIGDDQSVTYTIPSFVKSNKGNYRFKYVSSTSSFSLTATPEKAVQDAALSQNKTEYAQGDSVIIKVDQNKINAGFRFLGWYYNDELKSNNLEYKFDYNVSFYGNTFEARFEALDYTFEFVPTVNGSVTNANDIDLTGTRTYNALNGFTDATDQNSKQIIFTPDSANGYCIDNVVFYASNDQENTHSVYAMLNIDDSGVAVWNFDFAYVSNLISQANIADTTFVIKATFKHIVLNVNVQVFCDDIATTQDDLISYSIGGYDETNIKNFEIEYGESFVLTITSLKDGYKLISSNAILFDGVSQNIESSSTTIQVKQNGVLEIYIERVEYTINLSYFKKFGEVKIVGKAKVGETIAFVKTSVNTGYDFTGFYRGSSIDENKLLSTEDRYEFTFEIEYDADGNIITSYNYYAGFVPKSITFIVKSYDNKGNLLEDIAPITYKVGGTEYPLNNATFKYGQELELVVRNFEGYTFESFADDSVIKGTRVSINDEMLRFDGDKIVKLIYSANKHTITIYHNMLGATDKNGESLNISPAYMRYSTGNESRSFGNIKREVVVTYNSKIGLTISAISSDWTFVGLYEIITVDDQQVTNTLIEGSNATGYSPSYIVKDYDAEIIAYFTPKIEFKDFDDVNERTYSFVYTSNPVGIPETKVSMLADNPLRELMSITYNGSVNAPTNAGQYTLAIKFDSTRIPGLKNYPSPTATLRITPIELKFAYDGKISKVYDGTSSILVYSGLKIADGILRENDVDWLTISTSDANFSANFVLADKGVYYNRIDVADNYSVRFENLKLVSKVGDYSSKVNNYVFPDNSNTIIFNNIGSITKREIDMQNVLVVNKIYDGTTDIKFREGYSLNNAVLNINQIVKIGDLIDDVGLDYENISLSYSTKEVGGNVGVIFKLINNSTGLIGAKATNYTLRFPTLTGYTIHPNQVSITGDYGTITIVDIDNNLYLPLDLQIKVTPIRETSESYASIYGIIEPELSNNKNFGIGYNIALYSNGFEYKIINSAVKVIITPPQDMSNSRIDNILKVITTQDNTSVEHMTITADLQTVSFRTSELGTFVLVATRNPVPLWLIIVISVIVALAILFLCLYLFVIVPRKREKAYANFSKLEP